MILSLPLLLACQTDPVVVPAAAPEVQAPAPALRRLTQDQYRLAVSDLLGADLVLPTALEPDSTEDGLQSVGASVASVSALGVERYEAAALMLAAQVVEDDDRYAAVVPCDAATADDVDCAADFVETFGRRAWRRPLTEDEIVRIAAVVAAIGAQDGDFRTGVRYGLAAMLQSPAFLYRTEHGQPDPDRPGQRRLTDLELASRLSFLFWNTIPDDELLDAAEAGELSTDAGLRAQAERLVADPRAAQGVRALYTDILALYDLDDVSKDPTLFAHASEDLAPAAREETLRGIESLVLQDDGDLRDLLTTQRTFVDARLAALYGIPAADPDGFAEVWLEPDQGRRGLLGQAAILMLYAHSTRSSATLRGKFIRQRLLCQDIPAPPGDVDTSIPEPDDDSPTLRDRVAEHLDNPSCAACHEFMDPIGLGLENFDGIGRWRDTENGAVIDATGQLDGQAFVDAWQLGALVADHGNFMPCQTEKLYQYATGHVAGDGEDDFVDWLAEAFEISGGSVRTLMVGLATSPAFRQVGELDVNADAALLGGAP